MIKNIALLKRKAGLTREQFIAHYENVHVPLIRDQQGPSLIKYTRSYLIPGQQVAGPAVEGVDVVTECYYADEAGRDEAMRRLMEPEATRVRSADEASFLDTAWIQVFFVDERH